MSDKCEFVHEHEDQTICYTCSGHPSCCPRTSWKCIVCGTVNTNACLHCKKCGVQRNTIIKEAVKKYADLEHIGIVWKLVSHGELFVFTGDQRTWKFYLTEGHFKEHHF